jgi:asparagine synthase (glutamine-hydrolysing)
MSVQFGKWNFAGGPVAPSFLEKIETLLAPYGPDGTTFYSQSGVSVLYGALHSASESRKEKQPQQTESGTVITWDGRLDNRAELIALLREGLSIGSPDAAIVHAAYERWGTACFRKLLGDWALSVWNPADRSLLLAKDPVGTRPLYYSLTEREVAWSTILDPLVLFAEKTLALEEEYLAGCLSFFPAVHLTPYSGIHSVPPSCFVQIRHGSATTEKYWDFDRDHTIRYASDRDYEEHFRAVFAESVRRRLRSDRPVLAELSGGMDSSSIVCMADSLIARGCADAPQLDTVSYYDDSEPNWNERPFFSKVERQRGRAGLHIDVAAEQGRSGYSGTGPLRISPASEGEPSPAQKKLHAFLAERGHRVLLSGFGGDEVTGGVPVATSELADLAARAEVGRLARQLKVWALDKRQPWFHLFWETVCRFFPPALAGRPAHLRPAPWLDSGFVARHSSALAGYETRIRLFGPLPTFQENLSTLGALRRQLGASVLPAGPAYEKRYPYLDRELLEFLFAVPREQLLRPGRRRSLMRRALVGVVPEDVLNRKRKAFVARGTFVGISEQFGGLTENLDRMVMASLGIADPIAFRRELERARVGRETMPIALLRTIGIEAWLRNLDAGGLLKNQQPPRQQSGAARKQRSVPRESQRSFSGN